MRIKLMKMLSSMKKVKVKEHPRNANSLILISDDRMAIQEEVHSLLKKKNLKFTKKILGSLSSFPSTLVVLEGKTINVVYKPLRSGGSGGGAALTRLTESAQCLYAALAFKLKRDITRNDISRSNLESVSNLVFLDEKWENTMNLPEEWIDSCINGANLLRRRFGGSYAFHRGSPEVRMIESHFLSLRAKEGLSLDKNKWSPADIYLMSKDFKMSTITEERTVLGLNAAIKKELLEERLIGVSLKKIVGMGGLQEMNLKKKDVSISYDGYVLPPHSMDGYLKLVVDGRRVMIQFRSFGGESLTGWQGEIKGTSSNQGKISLGPINMILRNNGVDVISPDAASRARANDESLARRVSEGMVSLKSWRRSPENPRLVKEESNKWRYSKMQVIELLEILESQDPRRRSKIVKDIYLYASSQSKYSAAYMKLS